MTMPSQFADAIIENLQPLLNGGRYPIKRVVGEDVVVEADIFKSGHDIVAAMLKWRVVGRPEWHETAMKLVENDRWRAFFRSTKTPPTNTRSKPGRTHLPAGNTNSRQNSRQAWPS
jgi:hypothetical protein